MKYINETEAQNYHTLAAMAAKIEEDLQSLVVATVESGIPDEVKIHILDWVKRADTFRGLSYMLTPQSEWMGGDSQDAKNFKLRAPHIAK